MCGRFSKLDCYVLQSRFLSACFGGWRRSSRLGVGIVSRRGNGRDQCGLDKGYSPLRYLLKNQPTHFPTDKKGPATGSA
jgi:hypothetical protein